MFRNLLGVLAVLSVGTLQVRGVPAGYFCPCTGEESDRAACEQVVCHPEGEHADECALDCEPDSGSPEDCHGEAPASAPCGHPHSEVRESLEMTGSSLTVMLPAAVFYLLSPAFQMREGPLPDIGCECPEYPPDGSAPTPLLVARTMVMLV